MSSRKTSNFNHSICDECWRRRLKLKGEDWREPVRMVDDDQRMCCYCGGSTTSGIFVRDDPRYVPCMGQGTEHRDDS